MDRWVDRYEQITKCVYIYIYIYIYRERERERERDEENKIRMNRSVQIYNWTANYSHCYELLLTQ